MKGKFVMNARYLSHYLTHCFHCSPSITNGLKELQSKVCGSKYKYQLIVSFLPAC